MNRSPAWLLLALLPVLPLRAQENSGGSQVSLWVRELGAEQVERREAAQGALDSAGWKARSAVKEALASENPEVQRRAAELWEKLRWLVVPGADVDVLEMMKRCGDSHGSNWDLWEKFTKKHGPKTLYLLTQLRLSGDERNYQLGLCGALPQCSARDWALVVREGKDERERRLLAETLLVTEVDKLNGDASVRVAEVLILQWKYREAFDYCLKAWVKHREGALVARAAKAAQRGNLGASIWKESLRSVPEIKDPAQRMLSLAFFVGVAHELEDDAKAAPLVEKVILEPKELVLPERHVLYRLAGFLLEGDFEKAMQRIVDKQSGLMKLHLSIYLLPEEKREEGWKALLAALNEMPDEKGESEAFTIGEQMGDWGDKKSVELWQWILDRKPDETVYDSNALLRLIPYYEKNKRYAKAGLCLEEVTEMLPKIGGALIGTSREALVEKRDRLLARTARYFEPPAREEEDEREIQTAANF